MTHATYLLETLQRMRAQIKKMEPRHCCEKTLMVAGGKAVYMCAEECPWLQLESMLAEAMADASILVERSKPEE